MSSGGLGGELNLMLRAATLPGSEYVLPVLCAPAVRDAVRAVGRAMGAIGLRPGTCQAMSSVSSSRRSSAVSSPA